jgi:hypothetical protein
MKCLNVIRSECGISARNVISLRLRAQTNRIAQSARIRGAFNWGYRNQPVVSRVDYGVRKMKRERGSQSIPRHVCLLTQYAISKATNEPFFSPVIRTLNAAANLRGSANSARSAHAPPSGRRIVSHSPQSPRHELHISIAILNYIVHCFAVR